MLKICTTLKQRNLLVYQEIIECLLIYQNCFVESLLMMILEFLCTTWKPTAWAVDESNTKSKSCWLCTSMWGVWSIDSSCHWSWRSITKFTRRSYGVCFAQWTKRQESCGRMNHSGFTTIMHLLTTIWTSDTSWSIGISPYRNNLFIYLIWLRVTFFFSSRSKDHQGDWFWRRWAHQNGRNDRGEGIPE